MKRLLASCLGLGWLPIAPGTWGALPPTVVFALMAYLNASAFSISVTMAVLAMVGCVICVLFAPASIAAVGKVDPPEVVADEFAGQAVTFLAVPFLAAPGGHLGRVLAISLAGFLLFRVFDIIKPCPIKRLEKLPSGWGILADDLLAGVFAGICLIVGLGLWMYYSGPFE